MSRLEPVRLPADKGIRARHWALPLLLLPLTLLAACAQQPARMHSANQAVVPSAAASQGTAGERSPAADPASATPAPGAMPTADTSALTVPDGSSAESVAETSAEGASADVAQPASADVDSMVTEQPADLFDRIRSGFKLPDADEASVDSYANWFANHPDFLERTFDRSSLWLYYIVGQLEQRNMPTELALLPVIESAFRPYAYSHARAVGLWQFISDTGRRFGLKQDWWYDGRRDPIAATGAALNYLQALHDEFNGDWLLAIAAYDCGELVVSRAVERNRRLGLPTDFWHLRLPAETRGYVPELLAMRRIVGDPGRYGLKISPIPDKPYFAEINTAGQIDLSVVAKIAGISIDELYELNPGFLRWATDPTGPYRLLVPVDAAQNLQQTIAQLTPDERMRVSHYTVQRRDTVARLAQRFHTTAEVIRELNDLGPRQRLTVDTDLRVPSHDVQLPPQVAHAALLADRRLRSYGRYDRPSIHIVRRGDTLYSIARRMHTNVSTLAALNGIDPNDPLRIGRRLRVRGHASAPARKEPRRLLAAGAAHTSNTVFSAAAAAAAHGRRMMNYVVRRGDTLYGIARLLQVTVADLLSWNSLSRGGHDIKPGQVLVAFVKPRS